MNRSKSPSSRPHNLITLRSAPQSQSEAAANSRPIQKPGGGGDGWNLVVSGYDQPRFGQATRIEQEGGVTAVV